MQDSIANDVIIFFVSNFVRGVAEICDEEAQIRVTIVGIRIVDKLLGTISSRYTRASDLCEFKSELTRSAAQFKDMHVELAVTLRG